MTATVKIILETLFSCCGRCSVAMIGDQTLLCGGFYKLLQRHYTQITFRS